jgi:hypothetical protein
VPAAAARWSAMLAVQPVRGNLTAARDCTAAAVGQSSFMCMKFAATTTCGGIEPGSGEVTIDLAPYFGAETLWQKDGSQTTLPAAGGVQCALKITPQRLVDLAKAEWVDIAQ